MTNKKIKCNQLMCLNNENGICDITIPTAISKIKPNKKDCVFWEDEILREKLIEQIKQQKFRFMSDEEVENKKKERKQAKKEAREKKKKKLRK